MGVKRSVQKPNEITKRNEELWDSRAENYDKFFGFNRWTQKRLASLLELEGDPSLLEIACGTGWAERYAASLTNGSGEFYGIDISSKMIEEAEAKSVNCKNVHFLKGNAEGLPFGDNIFDYVICSNAFHHFSDPGKVVGEVHRVLKPHGKVYILDVTADGFVVRLADRFAKKLERGHVKIYSTEEYQKFYERAGLAYVAGKSTLYVKIHVGEKPL